MEYSRYNRSRTGLDWLISYLPKVPHLLLLQIKQVYELLSANYVEDVQAAFRFQYTAEFLEWYTSISFPCVITRSISVFLQGVETARMAEGMAYRCSCLVQQQTRRLHLWRSYPSPRSQEVCLLLHRLPTHNR